MVWRHRKEGEAYKDWLRQEVDHRYRGYSDREILKNATEDIHRLHPDYVFLTETSATPWGYFIKEALRKAYPNSKLPKFYRIDPKALSLAYGEGKHKSEASEIIKRRSRDFFKARISLKYPRIVIFDEVVGRHRSTDMVIRAIQDRQDSEINYPIEVVRPDHQALSFSTGVTGEFELKPYDKLTSKLNNNYSNPEKTRFTGEVIKSKDSLEYIRAAKDIGREIGAEIENGKSLEKKALVTTAIIGVLGSLFFLGSNITGNAIADLSVKTASFLGVGLLIIGLIAGFFWMRSRKK